MEVPDMTEEEIDVEEACDAGLVDREDLVNEKSKHPFSLFCSATIVQHTLCSFFDEMLASNTDHANAF